MTRFIDKSRELFHKTKDIVFSVRCPYCGEVIQRNGYACRACEDKFPEVPLMDYAVGGYPCVAPFPYADVFRKGLINFKFYGKGNCARQYAIPMVRSINLAFADRVFDIVTSVPLHKSTQRERRYNQAELLAKECAKLLNVRYERLLVKSRENRAQHSIKASERAKNVRGVFSAADKNLIVNKRILIIDDVITTGNTLGECARILKKCKCAQISCCTLCASLFK